MQYWFEVHFHVPHVSGALGQRLLAYSSDDAGRAIMAMFPGATIDWIKKLD